MDCKLTPSNLSTGDDGQELLLDDPGSFKSKELGVILVEGLFFTQVLLLHFQPDTWEIKMLLLQELQKLQTKPNNKQDRMKSR